MIGWLYKWWIRLAGQGQSFEEAEALISSRLASRRLQLVHRAPVDYATFGNTYTDFQVDGVCLRLTSDRGQLLITMSSSSDPQKDRWYTVDSLLEFIGKIPYTPRTEPIPVDEAVAELDAAWDEAVDLLRQFPARKRELDGFLQRRFENSIHRRSPSD